MSPLEPRCAPSERDGELRPEIPIVDCEVSPSGTQLTFECPICRYRGKPAQHVHGDPFAFLRAPGEIVGHRLPHCADRETFPHGYDLRVARPKA